MVDGVSGTDMYRVMFDTPPSDCPPMKQSSRQPSTLELMLRASGDALLLPVRSGRAVLGLINHPTASLRQASATARALRQLARAVPPARRSSLTGPIGQQRRYTWVRVPLEDVKTVKREFGGTINDTVLAAISAGFRALLMSRGETPHPTSVPSLVPVSLRAAGEENIYENRVSAMIVHLPVHLSDPVAQLTAVRQELTALKSSGEAAAGATIVSMASFVPYALASLTRLGFRIPQREIVTVTTNVPGPRQTLYCLGRPLVEILPYVPIASSIRTGVAIFSYRDQMTLGITGDYDTTGDLEVLAHGIADGFARLLKAVAEQQDLRP
jgi:WS/DGAT/MGAT family acyltransferase